MKTYNKEYSVALCTYNGEKFIEEQLNSIISQTLPPKEIVISDDGSTDDTLSIAEQILEKSNINYSIVKNLNEKGVTSNFCNAIALCNCDFIFTSDQDDVWLPKKAETILDTFITNENALLVFSNGYLVDEKLESLKSDMWSQVGINKKMIRKERWFEYLLKKCLITGATMAFKRNLFDKNETIPKTWLHDGWLSWKAAVNHGLVPCDNMLIMYRQHQNNVVGMHTYDLKKSTQSYFGNFKNMKDVHINRYQRYSDVLNNLSNALEDSQIELLNKCIKFWEDLVKADNEKRKTTRLRLVLWHLFNGDFRRFFNGFKGAIREIWLVFFK